MKFIFLLFTLLFSIEVFSQNEEFDVHPNGLIYSEHTMLQLGKIVDSLNLKYKKCEINKTYYSSKQTIGHAFSLDTGDIKAALVDIKQNMPFDEFLEK